jgi:ribosomal protein S27E
MEQTMEERTHFTVPVTVRCDKCGSDDIFVPEPEGSNDAITCNACGADLGTRAALDERVRQDLDKQIPDQLDAIVREAFEGVPNIKVGKRD